MSLKRLILFILLLNGSALNAQISVSVAHGNQHILYRGYENQVFLNSKKQDHWIVFSNNSKLVKDSLIDAYFVKPSIESAVTSLFIVDSITKDTLFSKAFDVISLPDPKIYIGGGQEGGRDYEGFPIYAKYDKESKLKANFRIMSYELSLNASTTVSRGSGNDLSGETLYLLKNLKPGTQIYFTVYLIGPDQIQRIMKPSFIL